ncbi:long-chain-fatty-acid CoA ligase [Striga asiatica]|uniref:Long-chain-fatty-acid CoA ligase n=1 Tax=Striga asiatica TaxID=4170 RepID=A0A5A7PUN7_STRAF|nr:long-chain-fatty-acid CoA ligase [Striga asiatica]
MAVVRVSTDRGKNSEDDGAENEKTKQKEKRHVCNGARVVTIGDLKMEAMGGSSSGWGLERRGWAATATVDEGSCWVEDSLLGVLVVKSSCPKKNVYTCFRPRLNLVGAGPCLGLRWTVQWAVLWTRTRKRATRWFAR